MEKDKKKKMLINIENNDKQITITVNRNLTMNDDTEFGKAMDEVNRLIDGNHYIFNMKVVESITSKALGTLVNFYKILEVKHRTMEIRGISDILYAQLVDIGFESFFPISKD